VNVTALGLPLVLVAAAAGTAATLQPGPRAPVAAVAPGAASVGGSTRGVSLHAPDTGVDRRAGLGTPPVVAGPLEQGPRSARGRWTWPLAPRPAVARPFVPPPTPYAAGHRGVDLAAAPGQGVRAVDAGVVTHVGRVAGRGTVTVTHVSGLRSTYEPVTAGVTRGQQVAQGGQLGTVAAGPSHCAPATCLHLGALRGSVYLDPLRLFGGGRVRLLPLGQAPDG
jgi:murein DD-endopeptidase MepM/ murein hydrolase activator NlpD